MYIYLGSHCPAKIMLEECSFIKIKTGDIILGNIWQSASSSS